MRRFPLLASVLVALASAGLAGCAGDGPPEPAQGCGPERREALDPASGSHVLAGQDGDGGDGGDPPTSGAHEASPLRSGVLDEPLTRAAQVGALEAGGILIQHRDLTDAEFEELAALAGEGIAVVPNPGLPERVVATAWLHKLSCDTVDVDALRGFAEAHLGQGPGSDG